jgi:hypothetical protein
MNVPEAIRKGSLTSTLNGPSGREGGSRPMTPFLPGIDCLVYELYDLAEEEIAIVEKSTR